MHAGGHRFDPVHLHQSRSVNQVFESGIKTERFGFMMDFQSVDLNLVYILFFDNLVIKSTKKSSA